MGFVLSPVASRFRAVMRRDELGAADFCDGSSGIGPCEGVSHRRVVVGHELPESQLQGGHRCEACSPQAFSVDDSEDHLDLIEPRTVFGCINEVDAVADIRQERFPCRH